MRSHTDRRRMKSPLRPTLLLIVLCLLAGCSAGRRLLPPDSRLPDRYVWGRVTSEDPAGTNYDFIRLEPGEERVIAEIDGPGEIRHLWFTMAGGDATFQNVVLRAWWDGADKPSLDVPISEFFMLPKDVLAEFDNAYLAISKVRGLNSFFPMPFRRGARISVRNDGPEPVEKFYHAVEYIQTSAGYAHRRPYFHAEYRQAFPAVDGEPYVVADIGGRGWFLGSALAITLNASGWWGEGDDLIEVDGRLHTGTGSEDYYGGAWGWASETSRGDRFGVPEVTDALEYGSSWRVYRFHEEAPIPFDDRFRLSFEHGWEGFDGRPGSPNSYASVAYYYQDRPRTVRPVPPAAERARAAIPLPRNRPGEWLEAENALSDKKLLLVHGGGISPRSWPRWVEGERWSGDGEALLVGYHSGTRYVWMVPIEAAGTYAVTLRHTIEPSGFDFNLYLNGQPWKEGLSGYGPRSIPVEVALPPVKLPAGQAMIEIVAAGADPRAVPPVLFLGLDAIRFTPSNDAAARDYTYRYPDFPREQFAMRITTQSQDHATSAVLVDLAPGNLPPIYDGPGVIPPLVPRVPGAGTGFQIPTRQARLITDEGAWTRLGRQIEFAAYIRPEGNQRLRHLISRNMAFSVWIDKGKLAGWMRDSDWRFLYLDTPEGVIPDDEWSHVRFSLDGRIARLFVNGALVRMLDMEYFERPTMYPGRTIIGGNESQITGFSGSMADVVLRVGEPIPPMGPPPP